MNSYKYLIIGGGLAGASAVDGIREVDRDGLILLLAAEKHAPYHRPPLSKHLWFNLNKVGIVHDPQWYSTKGIFAHDEKWYSDRDARLLLGDSAVSVDTQDRSVTDHAGQSYRYEKLLLATGGSPRHLDIPGGNLPGVCYYRTLDDFLALHPQVKEGFAVLVIGGGFIGSEMAAALIMNKADVTMLFPEDYLVSRVFPKSLGVAITDKYQARGVRVLAGDTAVSIEKAGDMLLTYTRNGREIRTQLIVAGIGILPDINLAQKAGIQTENGIIVNDRMQTSAPDIYAAGDNALFPYEALGRRMRLEHWDNALHQGKQAGRNMAGANEAYTYMPYFFSDLFEFGYEAVGDVTSKLNTFADWKKENDTGVIYYLNDNRIRGVMMCNVWDKVPLARQLIQKGMQMAPADLSGAIQ
jgi:3-phenylpropionate/trans-cinnamate dioxygenase ferredoxin reductase component